MNEYVYIIMQRSERDGMFADMSSICDAYTNEEDASKAIENLVNNEIAYCNKNRLMYRVEWDSDSDATITIKDDGACKMYNWFVSVVILNRGAK